MVYNGRDNTQMIDTALETVETCIRHYLGVRGRRALRSLCPYGQEGEQAVGAPSARRRTPGKPKSGWRRNTSGDLPEALKAAVISPAR
ncbi:MAG: hypothetical protein ACLS7Z_03760 [Christensenellales bacterium]